MFPEMRRHKQALSPEECTDILCKAESGVLAVNGCNGYPYTIPLNHVYLNGRLYFHSAVEGHKINAITKDGRVCFCVVAEERVNSATLSTRYRCVDVFGNARIIDDPDKKRGVLIALAKKFAPDFMDKADREIGSEFDRTAIIEITPEHISGKMSGDILAETRKA